MRSLQPVRDPSGQPVHVLSESKPSSSEATFDACAADYHHQLRQGLSVSGESPDYFAQQRILATQRLIQSTSIAVESMLDFGCGVGTAAPYLLRAFPGAVIIGSDISQRSIDEAAQTFTDPRLIWVNDLMGVQPSSLDLIYCNGVFHHIEPEQRDQVLFRLKMFLRPGGGLALWENNPWNPGTRWIMSRIPFDRDAKCLSPIETPRRLSRVGLQSHRTEHHFFFPRPLARMRRIEPFLHRVPFGAQYVVFATRALGSG